jgi:cell division protein FtsN
VIQIAAYRQKSAALQTLASLRVAGHDAYLEEREFMDKGLFYRVRLRGFANSAEAEATKDRLNKLGFVHCYIATDEKG